jgi:hypothetical protein
MDKEFDAREVDAKKQNQVDGGEGMASVSIFVNDSHNKKLARSIELLITTKFSTSKTMNITLNNSLVSACNLSPHHGDLTPRIVCLRP